MLSNPPLAPTGIVVAGPPTGITWLDPAPDITPMSAWPPTTRMDFARAARGRRPSFFKSTIPELAICRATLAWAA